MSYLAEQCVIGSLLLDQECISKVYTDLCPEMFRSEILAGMYLEFLRGYDNGYTVNVVMLASKMQSFPQDVIGQELKACVDAPVSSVEVRSYADIIIQEYKAGELNRLLQTVRPSADAVDTQIASLVNALEALQAGKKQSTRTLARVAQENKGKYFRDNEADRIYLGFPKLDDFLGGLEGGDMIVIGARPGVGKSAFVTQITGNLAKQGKRIGFYNLEMQEKQVYERFVTSQSGIGITRLRRAVRFLGNEEKRFREANEVLEKQENIIISTGSRLMSEIRNESRHMGYDIIIIDYLQLLRSDVTYRGNRYAEVGAISKAVKALAMELNIPVIALSQLNRVSEARENREPSMAELREAGDIEQDASVIMLLWNLSQKNRTRKGCKVEKNRQGETGKVVLEFDGDLMKFRESGESVESAQEWAEAQDDDCPF